MSARLLQLAANSQNRIMQSIDDASPDFARIVQAGQAEEARNYTAKLQQQAANIQTGIRNKTDLAVTKQNDKTARKIRGIDKKTRMAGMLAGGAALIGAGIYQKNKKQEVDPTLALIAKQNEFWKGQAAKAQGDITSLQEQYANLPDIPTVTDAPSNVPVVEQSASNTSSTLPVQPGSSKSTRDTIAGMVRFAEGTVGDKGYTTMFGGGQFTDMSKHPNKAFPTPWGTKSEAAGAYQFMKPTWDGVQKALNLPDFSRESQEKAFDYLATNRGVDLNKPITSIDDLREVTDKLAPEWAGLPYSKKSPGGYGMGSSYYGQGGKSLEELWEYIQNN